MRVRHLDIVQEQEKLSRSLFKEHEKKHRKHEEEKKKVDGLKLLHIEEINRKREERIRRHFKQRDLQTERRLRRSEAEREQEEREKKK